MHGIFEVTISRYSAKGKKLKELYLVQAHSFTEAEANITQHLTGEEIKGFQVTAMRRNAYEDFLYKIQQEAEKEFFEAKVKVKFDGEMKEYNYKYLVAADNVKDATAQITEYIEDNKGKPRIIQVKHRAITNIILLKECKEQGTILVSFEKQREIERRIMGGQSEHEAIKELRRLAKQENIKIEFKK